MITKNHKVCLTDGTWKEVQHLKKGDIVIGAKGSKGTASFVLGFVLGESTFNREPVCQCGAKHTSRPNTHYDWCDSYSGN